MIIYLIRNKINNKTYIGLESRKNKDRWLEHKSRSQKDNSKQLIDKKIKQYGINNFEYIILCECKDVYELKRMESYYINLFNSYIGNGFGYNLTSGGEGSFSYKNKLFKSDNPFKKKVR